MTTEELFTAHLRECLSKCRELGESWPTVDEKIALNGGVKAAKSFLVPGKNEGHTGFQRMVKRGYPELTIEYAVLDDRFSSMFTSQEKELARWRLNNSSWAKRT